jgi:hypothetical protein
MQALGLGYSRVLAKRAGGQSTFRLWLDTSPQGGTASPVKSERFVNFFLNNISIILIIQGRNAKRFRHGMLDTDTDPDPDGKTI